MSFFPGKDPEVGDAFASDQIELMVIPNAKDIGGFQVRRALPTAKRRLVGPFIFFDRMGPAILRAGLGMLDGMSRLLPTAEVGFLGLVRDEETFKAVTYANRLPDDLTGRHVFLIDPMLATGGTLVAAIDYVLERGAREVTVVCLLAAPEGIKTLEEHVGDRANLSVVVAAVDERLNEKAYIVPGLGDAGDRLYGIV